MSITEEGANPSAKPTASDNPEQNPSGQNGASQTGTGLSGLAGFGQMQGYAPVTGQPQADEPAAEPEPEIPAAIPEDAAPQYDEQEQHQHTEYALEHSEFAPVQYTDAGIPENGVDAAYASADAPHEMDSPQDYIPGQESVQEYQPEAAPISDPGLNVDPVEFQNDPGLQGEPGTSLQTFEAHYDQHPEIPLGAFEDPAQEQPAQPFFHEPGQTGDADFLGGGVAPEVAEPKERRGRKILMASSGLIGVLALGGALAFAYKIGGDSDIASAGKPPLIQADSRPVKVAPDKPGGKKFPHKNKKIYERLGGSDTNEVERLVSRQEDVAAAATAAIGGATPASGAAADGEPASGASAPVPGAPRKVKTLTVRPDGTMEPSSPRQKIVKAPAAPVSSGDGGVGVAMTFPQAPASAPPAAAPALAPVKPNIPKPVAVAPPPPAATQQTAAAPASAAVTPDPVQKPPVPRAVAPASPSSYVVQVAARKSQTDALAAFADIQQKYPRLLSGYRPIIKRADLGSKGVWYRLNVGPVESKTVASSLCGQLKSAGMRSCLVRAQ
ncbi:sporulation related domain protein [bacterium BMS3Bbin10]|nr:sporulation related domain protein [bacterium BMS3Bbin10]